MRRIDAFGDELVGFRDGWRGVLESSYIDLDIEATRGILPRGGTILGSSRTNPYKRDDSVERVPQTLTELNIDALIAICGEDTLGIANKLHQDGMNVIGVPRTIDTTWAPPMSPSGSTRHCRSRQTRSTASTPQPRATTGSWSSK